MMEREHAIGAAAIVVLAVVVVIEAFPGLVSRAILENVIIYPTDDTWARDQNEANHGTEGMLTAIDMYASTDTYAFLKFPMSFPPSKGILSAVFQYYGDSSANGPGIVVHRAYTDWKENELTGINWGSKAYDLGESWGGSVNVNGWNSVDITDSVRAAFLAGAKYYALRVQATGAYYYVSWWQTHYVNTVFTFRSKEYLPDLMYAPRLVVQVEVIENIENIRAPTLALGKSLPGSRSDNLFSVILRGRVENMGDEQSMTVGWDVWSENALAFHYALPTAITQPQDVSISTPQVFQENKYYFLVLKAHGQFLQADWKSEPQVFWITENAESPIGWTIIQGPTTIIVTPPPPDIYIFLATYWWLLILLAVLAALAIVAVWARYRKGGR